jgi:predicted GNAT superfamily acetyltransferase
MPELRFRDLHTADEFRQVMDLEQQVWGFTDLNDMVTVPVFTITTKRGAILIGAFDEAERMVGFVYSIVGRRRDGQILQWSHMLGVLPEYRNSGLGRALKLAQRDKALAQGYELIEWTFDPLQALNAHLNFAKLGVVAEEYHRNVYGESTSVLHKGTPTDRLVAQWWIARPHVARRIANEPPAIPVATHEVSSAAPVNTTRQAQTWLANAAIDLERDDRRVVLEIPMGFTEMQRDAPALALEWRTQTREIFEAYFRKGYRAVDFFLDRARGRGRYLLARDESAGV